MFELTLKEFAMALVQLMDDRPELENATIVHHIGENGYEPITTAAVVGNCADGWFIDEAQLHAEGVKGSMSAVCVN